LSRVPPIHERLRNGLTAFLQVLHNILNELGDPLQRRATIRIQVA
jgi:hypothetical protein